MPAIPGYLKAMKKVCDDFGALFIVDEIMCGTGRCGGTLHAWQEEDGFVPDIQLLGKGLGGGVMQVSAVLASSRVVEVVERSSGEFAHGHTHDAYPIACAVGLEVLKTIRKEGLLENVREMGKRLSTGLKEGLDDHRYVGDIRGRGLFWGVSCLYSLLRYDKG